MTVFEFALVRQVGVLKEEAKRRKLTDEEVQFLARVRALMDRLVAQERKQ